MGVRGTLHISLRRVPLLCIAIKNLILFNQQAKTKTKLDLFDQAVFISYVNRSLDIF